MHVERAAVTTFFSEIMLLKGEVKPQRPTAFSDRKPALGGAAAGDMGKKQMECMFFSHFLRRNGYKGMWRDPWDGDQPGLSGPLHGQIQHPWSSFI